MFSKILFVLTSVSAALAAVSVTAPIDGTTFPAGQQAAVTWRDDGAPPSLQQFGPAKISIYVGNQNQQTSLQLINGSVDVSQVSSLTFTPDATIGPNSDQYFIRIESLSLKDATQSQFPALAFSHKFSLSGMTGVFSADVLAQISGQATAPIAPQTSGAPPAGGNNAVTSTSQVTVTKSSSTGTAAPQKTSTHPNAAIKVGGMGLMGTVLAAVVGAALF